MGKISDLTTATAITADDYLVMVDDPGGTPATKKITAANAKTYLGGGAVATDAIFDAKGDLPVGTGADTAAKLTVGSNDSTIYADSGQSTGMRYGWGGPTATADHPLGKSFVLNMGGTAFALTQNRIHFLPVAITRTITISTLGVYVTTGAGSTTIKLGIYSTGTDGAPSTLIDSTSIDSSSSGSKTGALGSNQQISAGTILYVAAMAAGGTPSAYGMDSWAWVSWGAGAIYGAAGPRDNTAIGSIYYKAAASGGTLDATVTSPTYGGTACPSMWVGVASAP